MKLLTQMEGYVQRSDSYNFNEAGYGTKIGLVGAKVRFGLWALTVWVQRLGQYLISLCCGWGVQGWALHMVLPRAAGFAVLDHRGSVADLGTGTSVFIPPKWSAVEKDSSIGRILTVLKNAFQLRVSLGE